MEHTLGRVGVWLGPLSLAAASEERAAVQELELRRAWLESEEAERGAEQAIPLNIGHDEVARPESSRAERSSSFSVVSGFSR